MILFIAPYAKDEKEKREGYMQRILAIDSLFGDKGEERVYFEIDEPPVLHDLSFKNLRRFCLFIKSYFQFIKRKLEFGKYEVNKINNNLTHIITNKQFSRELLSLAKKARLIYFHTASNAQKAMFLYDLFPDKTVTDIHGVQSEEIEYNEGNKNWEVKNIWKLIRKAEDKAFLKSKYLVAVTETMADYYQKKYKDKITGKFIILPIFSSETEIPQKNNVYSDKPQIIYSGGTHKWQNVSLMITAISKLHTHYNFKILTGDLKEFQARLENNNLLESVELLSVNKTELFEHYRGTDFGFLLRDDIAVNHVACPTKLIEYMQCGIIPIVLQPEIGDFNRLGYSYVLYDDLLRLNLPSGDKIREMKENNRKVVEKLKEQSAIASKELVSI